MFDSKTLKTIALTICSAFIIGILSGTAQASVAERNSIDKNIKRAVNYSEAFSKDRRGLKNWERQEKFGRESARDRGTKYRDDSKDRRGGQEPARPNYRPAPPPR